MLAVRVYSPNPVGCVDFVVYLNDQTIDFITYHTEVAVFVLRRKSTILFYAKNDKLKERTQNFYLAFLRIRWLRSKRDEWRMKTKPIKWFSVWIFFSLFVCFTGFVFNYKHKYIYIYKPIGNKWCVDQRRLHRAVL